MTRYQYASVMMVLWGIWARSETGAFRVCASVIGALYAFDAAWEVWKNRTQQGAA